LAVTATALVFVLVQLPWAQFIGRAKVSKGPRAIGLVEILPTGKARLIPIAIMVNGKFYDAGAYKASPVPMALEQGTVYEAQHTGISAGLFTVNLVGQAKNAWIAEGSWLPAGAKPAKSALRAETKPIMGDENDAPPTLRRNPSKPSAQASAPTASTDSPNGPPAKSSTGANQPSTTSSPPASASSAPAASTSPSASPSPSNNTQTPSPAPNSTNTTSAQPSDNDSGPHPVLKRGSRDGRTQAEKIPVTSINGPDLKATKTAGSPAAPSSAKPSPNSSMKVYAAVSDANGPELRPFAYEAKPDDEARFRKTMLDLAANEIRARARLIGAAPPLPEVARSKTPTRKPAAKGPQPSFDSVELRIFDMSNSNEPTLVLTATAHLPASGKTGVATDLQYFVTVVGRWDINGDMHNIFSHTTDSNHLEAISRLELIDAVDADGDNRGDLLFREISDSDTSYVIYRVSPDKLWPLFDSGSPES
jgi:hypothetical protein